MEKSYNQEITDPTLSAKIQDIMRDPKKLVQFAEAANKNYFLSQPENAGKEYLNMYPSDFDPTDPGSRLKLAQNTVGFAALQETLDDSKKLGFRQIDLLDLIALGTVDKDLKRNTSKLVHAIWYQTSIVRGTINRDVVRQFDQLPEDEKEKDWRQVVTAARTLQKELYDNFS